MESRICSHFEGRVDRTCLMCKSRVNVHRVVMPLTKQNSSPVLLPRKLHVRTSSTYFRASSTSSDLQLSSFIPLPAAALSSHCLYLDPPSHLPQEPIRHQYEVIHIHSLRHPGPPHDHCACSRHFRIKARQMSSPRCNPVLPRWPCCSDLRQRCLAEELQVPLPSVVRDRLCTLYRTVD